MLQSDFAKLLEQLQQLNSAQRQRLLQALEPDAAQSLRQLLANPGGCPHCHADVQHMRPWGASCGLPRRRCLVCKRTSNALSTTPLAHLRKRALWLRFAQALIEGLSVRACAQRCGVDKNTAFRWRHRFLQASAQHRPACARGIVEADETFFLESCKGQRNLHRAPRKRGGVGTHDQRIAVLVVRDRSGQTADYRLQATDTAHVCAVLEPLIDKDAILCTDGAYVYRQVARRLGVCHRAINLARGVRVRQGAFHIQNVNAYDSRLKQWMRRFHGVASRYLENYLGWRRMLERYKAALSPAVCLQEAWGHPPLQQVMQT